MIRITESQWIEYYGFKRFPFDRPEAGNEEFSRPDFLATCFLEPERFERILGQTDPPATALLFAARGTGKTACRVMVDYYCRAGIVPSAEGTAKQTNYVLSVPHINLHRPLELARAKAAPGSSPIVRVEHHTFEILSQAMPVLVELIAHEPILQAAIDILPIPTRQELSWLLFSYRYQLTPIQAEFLYNLSLWPASESRNPIGFPVEDELVKRIRPFPGTLELWQSWRTLSPLDHLTQFVRLVKELGIRATYILVDGVDEFTEAAGDPEEAYRVIRPLLTTLRMMDSTPYLALKFFLPDQVEPFIRADPAFRPDRGFIIEHLRWNDEALIEILRRRLDALKVDTQEDRLLAGFDTLCVPELRGQIENDLAYWAQGNPRHLMLLCGLIVTAHCSSEVGTQADPYQLNQLDVEKALAQFAAQISGWHKPVVVNQSLTLSELIAQGEHDRLEFKASLQWNLRKGATDKEMRANIGRAIVGMMNRYGGKLLIGVADDGSIVGIENDLKAIRKGNEDGFQLEIGRIVETYLGLEYAPYKQVHFEAFQDKRVCIIEIHPCPQPVYFRGNNISELWVRLDNSTRKLDIKAAMTYIQSHWGKPK